MSEEDTVNVGQDLVKIELGEAPEGGKKESAPEQPKEESKEAPAEKPKESAPEPPKPQPTQASKPAAPEKPKETKAEPSKSQDAKPALGNREERRVRITKSITGSIRVIADSLATIGQDEPHASSYR